VVHTECEVLKHDIYLGKQLLTFRQHLLLVPSSVHKNMKWKQAHTVHKLSQRSLTAEWLAPRDSECSRIHSKVSSDLLPSNIKTTWPVLETFKMAGYFPDSPRILPSKTTPPTTIFPSVLPPKLGTQFSYFPRLPHFIALTTLAEQDPVKSWISWLYTAFWPSLEPIITLSNCFERPPWGTEFHTQTRRATKLYLCLFECFYFRQQTAQQKDSEPNRT
jgi:hypothetical protein